MATSSCGLTLVRGLVARTSTRTAYPASRAVLAMADPTKPDAPVTSTRSWLNACSRLIGSDPARASSARLDHAALTSQHLEHPRDNARGVEPGPGIHALGLIMVD